MTGKRILTLLATVPLALAELGCGDPNKKTAAQRAEGSISDQPFKVLEGKELKTEGGVLAGAGKLVFVTPRTDDANSYELAFTLADGGSLTLVANAGPDLGGGVSVTFTRTGAKLGAAFASGGAQSDASARFEKLDASEPLALVLDVHNNETPVHALVWRAGDRYDDDGALFNSDADAELKGNGKGRIWGLELKDATVTAAKGGAAKFSE